MKVETLLDTVDRQILELKKDYELFFSGERRIPPEKLRQKVKTALLGLTNEHLGNTSHRFRLKSLQAKFNSFSRLWDRIMLQIEMGTYKPNQFKADLRVGKLDKKSGTVEKSNRRIPDRFVVDPQEQDNKNTQNLYRTFIETRRVTGENVNVSYESFEKSINNNRGVLKEKFGNKFEFKISIENGKAKVKGIAKR
jgi:hypothetical protein